MYGYYIGENSLRAISPDKELLQEILMDDYFEDAFYEYNLRLQHNEFFPPPINAIDFWKWEKRYPTLMEQYIVDLGEKYIE